MAAPGSVCRASKTASGSVCVRPWRLPANVIVAPNSPSARAHASTAPATSCGRSNGSTTWRSRKPGEAPSVAAASSYRSSIDRSPASTARMTSGIDTNAAATTAPAVLNVSWMPAVVQEPAHEAAPPERGEQPDAGHDRRQHERQDHDGAQHGASREPRAREDPAERRAQHHRDECREERDHQGQPERRERGLGREQRPRVGPRGAHDEPQQRQDHEGGAGHREHRDDGGRGAPARGRGHGGSLSRQPAGRKPNSPVSLACPGPVVTYVHPLLREVRVRRPLHDRDRVGGDHVHVVGDVDRLHAGRDLGRHVGDVHDAGVGLARGDRGDDGRVVLGVRHDVGEDSVSILAFFRHSRA